MKILLIVLCLGGCALVQDLHDSYDEEMWGDDK